MKNIQKIFAAICFITIAAITFNSCVDQDFDQPEVKIEKYNGTANTTIADLKAMLPDGEKVKEITADQKLVVSGYVVSSDEGKMFYKQLIIQDKPENPTSAITIDVNVSGITALFPVGQQVFIELDGLSLVESYGVVKLSAGLNNEGKSARISDAIFRDQFHANGAPVEITPLNVSISDFSNDLLGCLIQVSDVQFADGELGKNYGDPEGYASRTIVDKTGQSTTLKVSKYATFVNEKLPEGSGTIAAILNTYSGSFELAIRTTEDVKLVGERFKEDNVDAPASNATIEEIQAMRKDREFVEITEDKVIEGVVISSDEQGNFYKTLVIQETKEGANLRGIEVAVNVKGLYAKYPLGQKVVIKCKGLLVADNYGIAKLGASTYKDKKGKIKLGGIEEGKLATTVIKVGKPIEVTPKTVQITELDNTLLSCLVKFEPAQFIDSDKDKTYGEKDKYATRTITDKAGNTIVMSTSGYAKFINEKLPQGSGSIVSVLNIYSKKYQLNIRSTADVDMKNSRFDVNGGDTNVQSNATIEEIQNMRQDKKFVEITEDKIIEGVVISSDEQGNYHKEIVIQETKEGAKLRGIQVAINVTELYKTYPLGQKVMIKCKGLLVADNYGVAKIGANTYKDKKGRTKLGGIEQGQLASTVIKVGEPTNVTPKTVKITELNNDLLSCLIKIEKVQFIDADKDKTYGESKKYIDRTITDVDNNKIVMNTSGYAKFINEKLPQGSGSIVSVLNLFSKKFQLKIRSTADVDMKNPRFDTGGGDDDEITTAIVKVFISEYCEGSGNNKYIEIYNNTGAAINLADYAIKLAANGGNWDKTNELEGTLENGKIYIIAADQADKTILAKANLKLSYPSAIHFNGDDAIGLFKKDADKWVLVDAVGKQGEKKVWEVAGVKGATKDHTLIRKAEVEKSNPDWATCKEEWVVKDKNDFSNIGVRNPNDNGDDDDDNNNVTANATINDIKAMRQNKKFVEITDNKVIEGIVISSDEQGNFHKVLVIQEAKEGAPLSGIKVAVNVTNLYNTYAVGQKVLIKCKGLLVADDYGVAKLGANTYKDKKGKTKLGGIEQDKLASTIIKVGEPTNVTPKTVKITELNNDLLSCLIKIEKVQFIDADKDKTYGESKKYIDRTITDIDKNNAVMNTSGYAKFINEKLPQGSGSIVSILDVFSKKFQLKIRSTADVDMKDPRFDIGGGDDDNNDDETTPEGINLGDKTVSGAADLFISEYVEGSGSNKYLEIFNGTGKEVDLSKYTLKIGSNGKKFDDPKVSALPLKGKLPNGATLVIKNKDANLTLPEGKTATAEPAKATYYNGDDAIGLFNAGKLIDVFGIEGEDPGKGWTVNGIKNGTVDHTLIRVSSVKSPTTTWKQDQWKVEKKNDVSNIGSHQMDK